VVAKIAKKPAPGERCREQKGDEKGHLRGRMASCELDNQDERAEDNQEQCDDAMEAAGLGMRPGVERSHDLTPLVGVGTASLHRACIADVCASLVTDESPFAVELVRPKLLALWTEPEVMRVVVAEAGSTEAKCAPMRVRGEPFQQERAESQEAGIGGGEEGLCAQVNLAAAASSSPAAARPLG
jgi:hypothetical protein